MKAVNDLELGFSDAENYRRRENKSLLNRVFIRNHNLDRLCDPAISFVTIQPRKPKKVLDKVFARFP